MLTVITFFSAHTHVEIHLPSPSDHMSARERYSSAIIRSICAYIIYRGLRGFYAVTSVTLYVCGPILIRKVHVCVSVTNRLSLNVYFNGNRLYSVGGRVLDGDLPLAPKDC